MQRPVAVKNQKLFRRSRVAEMASVTPRTVARWEADGILPGVKINSRLVMYRESDVTRLLNGELESAASKQSLAPVIITRAKTGQFAKGGR